MALVSLVLSSLVVDAIQDHDSGGETLPPWGFYKENAV